MFKRLVVLISMTWAGLYPAFCQDRMLDLLKTELKSQMTELGKGEYPPYYMNYRVIDTYSRVIKASMGAVNTVETEKQIIFVPQVRVGSPEFDNFHESQNGVVVNRFAGPPTILLPYDTKSGFESFREIIREEVNSRYK